MEVLGIAESLHQESKIQEVQSVPYLAYQVAYNNFVGSTSVNRAWFELFALLGAKILQTPVQVQQVTI